VGDADRPKTWTSRDRKREVDQIVKDVEMAPPKDPKDSLAPADMPEDDATDAEGSPETDNKLAQCQRRRCSR
jgi:hypothetical protein